MALIIVHPFCAATKGSVSIKPLTGTDYIQALIRNINEHKDVALYDACFIESTLELFAKYGITRPMTRFSTKTPNVGFLSIEEEMREIAWLKTLDTKEIVCAGGYVLRNNPEAISREGNPRDGCLEMVINRLQYRGFCCRIDTDAAFTWQ